ncbi:efflux RND transporter periplasmic adaptor subunit [Chenggangzhangella methanolivorans]|uniref:Efflux RND transporter periplasmic adaptor subunit n=1 Tax=Chenggangzhangella methanolivorans TaxID=1437009 RepID=A0A9E6R7X3_9HYPH|nr:efflux RND transporter periplasmic adaptor subunit [Chenggangzhangella methanolivorans]QZN98934.1 efflux RND transporter periplasmic adaptor subunit [Chenggangzhangella methanolivorans]
MRTRAFTPLACAFAAATLLAACKDESKAPPAPKVAVVAQPKPVTATRYLYETGVAKAVNRVDLIARVSGFLKSIDYKDGAEVKAGQRLFLIEPELYEAQVQQAEASLAQSGATFDNAQRALDRQRQLLKTSATPEVNVDNAQNSLESARGQRAAADASLVQARLNLSYATVVAPFDGAVSEHKADVGALVGSGGVTTLATIVQLDPIHVTFSISDADLLRIRRQARERGLTRKDIASVPIEIGVKGDDGYPIKGRLDYAAPETSADTGTLSVRAVFENADRALLPDLFVRVRIPVETVKDALLVPPSAIGTDQQGRYVLVVTEKGVVERRSVSLIERDGELQQVRGALMTTDWVIQNVASGPRPGDAVDRREAATQAREQFRQAAGSTSPSVQTR